jgi:hypothetical protein
MNGDSVYMAFRGALEQQLRADPANAKLQGELTKLILTHGQEKLGPITAEVIRLAKGGALIRQTARDSKVAGQAKASAADPKGTTIAPVAPQAQTPRQLDAQIRKEYADAHDGQQPDTATLIAEKMKRSKAFEQKKAS